MFHNIKNVILFFMYVILLRETFTQGAYAKDALVRIR
jgi:hypothetical protein